MIPNPFSASHQAFHRNLNQWHNENITPQTMWTSVHDDCLAPNGRKRSKFKCETYLLCYKLNFTNTPLHSKTNKPRILPSSKSNFLLWFIPPITHESQPFVDTPKKSTSLPFKVTVFKPRFAKRRKASLCRRQAGSHLGRGKSSETTKTTFKGNKIVTPPGTRSNVYQKWSLLKPEPTFSETIILDVSFRGCHSLEGTVLHI